MAFTLFSSEGCHLCELAFDICQQEISKDNLNVIDIVDEEKLVEEFGIHIPVLGRSGDSKKLFWPFDQNQVRAFVKELV